MPVLFAMRQFAAQHVLCIMCTIIRQSLAPLDVSYESYIAMLLRTCSQTVTSSHRLQESLLAKMPGYKRLYCACAALCHSRMNTCQSLQNNPLSDLIVQLTQHPGPTGIHRLVSAVWQALGNCLPGPSYILPVARGPGFIQQPSKVI